MADSQLIIPPHVQRQLAARQQSQVHPDSPYGQYITMPNGQRQLFTPGELDRIQKSMTDARAKHQPYRANPIMANYGAYNGIKERDGLLYQTMQILRKVPTRCPILGGAIRRRQNQSSNWWKRPRWESDPGIQVVQKDRPKSPTSAAKQRAKYIEGILFDGGIRTEHPRTGQTAVWNAERSKRAPGLARSMRQIVWDSLVLDAAAFELQEGMNSKKFPIVYWAPVDAAKIRYAQPQEAGEDDISNMTGSAYQAEIRPDLDDVSYVMMSQDMGIEKEYSWRELAYLVRNERTDEWSMGYGQSEIEMLVDIISGILYGVETTIEYFDNNKIPEGFINLPGTLNQPLIDDFRGQLAMMVSGKDQLHAVPIVTTPDGLAPPSFIKFREPDAEMRFVEWLKFCTVVVAEVYGMDPDELGFMKFGQTSNGLGQGSNEASIEQNNEDGLVALLSSILPMLQEHIVEVIDSDFEVEYSGLGVRDQAERIAGSTYRIETGMGSVNSERALMDMRPIYDPIDDQLWTECVAKARKQASDPNDAEEIEDLAIVAYEKAGGQRGKWVDAPQQAGLMQIWMQEHGIGQQQQPGEMGEDPNAQGQEGDEEEAPDPNRGYVPDVGDALKDRQLSPDTPHPPSGAEPMKFGPSMLKLVNGDKPTAKPLKKSLDTTVFRGERIEIVIRKVNSDDAQTG